MSDASKLLDFIFLRNRREITVDGELIIDLTEQVVEFAKPLTYSHQPVLVTPEFAGRPHLIAKMVYGSEDWTDLLCFFNGIALPVALEAGTVLAIPDLQSILANIKDLTKDETANVSQEEFVKKMSKKDVERLQQLIAANNGNTRNITAPNMTKTGTSAVTPVDGKIILGTNISETRCKNKLSAVQTLTEQIRSAVKQSIIQAA